MDTDDNPEKPVNECIGDNVLIDDPARGRGNEKLVSPAGMMMDTASSPEESSNSRLQAVELRNAGDKEGEAIRYGSPRRESACESFQHDPSSGVIETTPDDRLPNVTSICSGSQRRPASP